MTAKKTSRPKTAPHPAARENAPTPRSRMDLLRRLSEAPGVSGNEQAVRRLVLEALGDTPAETRVDALGNLIVRCRTRGKPGLRVMVAAHMDEVGLMLVQATGEGMFKFEMVGGVDERTLLAVPVKVGPTGIPGVIGAKPAHLLEHDESTRPVKPDSMTIDIGAAKKDAALAKAKPGEWAVFATCFQATRGVLRGKALDDRLGVAALIELALDPPPGVELFAAFTVQEEIGLRGAKVAAHSIDPQAAFVLDATPAHDMPKWDGTENVSYNTRLGAGPAVYLADRGTLYDARLIRLLTETASAKGIPHQLRQPGAGGTDAASIHLARAGVPCAALSVPCRSIHTPIGVARQEDWIGQIELIRAALTRLGQTGLRK